MDCYHNNFNLPLIFQYVLEYSSCIIVALLFLLPSKRIEAGIKCTIYPKVLFIALIVTFCLSYIMGYAYNTGILKNQD